ncbi:ent-copalyl diphosphate synthase, chloroplastic-like isoform X2 [Olea europaea var. sylvestris]|uniref:ent-copalyl diphosphate synthase, chloroplastic-like isoform X2 n=1 Tax=Olea europaea var. sylvestris TaxID=158386 RepID=UPI000C1CD31E|nr:ent-copalyl diphosphate synthase, chloroplastic-like isoform X2 [Olea europaea var. sylvestris]
MSISLTFSSIFLLRSSTTTTAPLHIPATTFLCPATTSGIWPSWKQVISTSLLQCKAVSKSRAQGYTDVLRNDFQVIKWPEIVEDDTEKDPLKETKTEDRIRELVESIRWMLCSMEDGEISVSAYDTAWVALVEDIGGSGAPQFPSSLYWIVNHQLDDGSWGDMATFTAHDRIINTLACVVALRSWNMHPDKSEKGIKFIRENMDKLEDENAEHMPIGFELAFPSLIGIAKKLEIDIPYDSPVLKEIYAKRSLKLKRIPKDIMHKVPTTILHSLEGMPDLDWQKLLKLQSSDGSFLFSPSSTAFALQQTKDDNCLKYLTKAVKKFNGGVPNVYPVDLFEHIWAVDRLQRLGISRFFQKEIEECMEYVHRYWTNKGICWARNSEVQDIDDTAMGFRLLRLHGYEVSADVFKHFENGGKFFCFAGQSNQAVTGMYNLYRASQVMFPGENILAEAKKFSAKFLQEKRANNELLDKWIITKDLTGEVGYALDVSWYASLPRVETRFYLEQYGGEDDVWIGKTLYRMGYVNNDTYLELAKLDYNNCQELHQLEWRSIQKWYTKYDLGEFGMSEGNLLLAYYLATASYFEPEKSKERLAWAKTTILMETIASYFDRKPIHKKAFIDEFLHGNDLNYANGRRTRHRLVDTLLGTLNQLSLDTLLAYGRDVNQQLHRAWDKWIRSWEGGSDVGQGEAELLVRTLNLISDLNNHWASHELLSSQPKYQQLLDITNRVCHRLRLCQHKKVTGTNGCITTVQIESDMQELLKLVYTKSSDDIDTDTKKTFLNVARSFYYAAYSSPGTINFHIAKVLFERVR